MAAALLMPQAVQAVTIPAGYDYFNTDYGSVDMPGSGTIQLQGFHAWTAGSHGAIPLPAGALPAVRRWIEVQWLDQHGTVVGRLRSIGCQSSIGNMKNPCRTSIPSVARNASMDTMA